MRLEDFRDCKWLVTKLTLILGLTLVTLPLQLAESAGPFADDVSEKAISPTMVADATPDPYWEYYSDCDRWGIEFGVQGDGKNVSPDSRLEKAGPSTRRVSSPIFQSVKFVKPDRPLYRSPSVNSVGMLLSFSSQTIASTLKSGSAHARANFQRHVQPLLASIEFAVVEGQTHPEFFLPSAAGPWKRTRDAIAVRVLSLFVSCQRRISLSQRQFAPDFGWNSGRLIKVGQHFLRVLQNKTVLQLDSLRTWDF